MKKTALLALSLLALPLFAADTPPAKMPAQTKIIDDVVVPVPSEIFAVLDKIGQPNWSSTQRPLKSVVKPFGPQAQQAFYLGTVIAEGFIAVEAKDKEEVKIIGRSVISLSNSLGVRSAVVQRANAIIMAANEGDWPTVRRELDGALSNVKDALGKLESEELADMISLGGWLRGTDALCEVVAKNYSADGADLLHQPALVNHFADRLAKVKPRNKSNPLVGKAQTALKSITPLMATESGAEVTEKTVKAIGEIAKELVKEIQTQPK